MYLSVATRPDFAFAISHLSQFTTKYSEEHWKATKRVLRYLKKTANFGLCYRKEPEESLVVHCDAAWGNCALDRKSQSGFVTVPAGAAVSWESRKQQPVALSSTEAEYVVMSEATKEVIYLGRLLMELLGQPVQKVMYCDNQGAISLAQNPVFHKRTKHIAIRYHFVRDAVNNNEFTIVHSPTNKMVADFLTSVALSHQSFFAVHSNFSFILILTVIV